MASMIERAVAQSEMGGGERLRGQTPTVQFQAAQQHGTVGNNGFADSMMNFVKAGTSAYGAYTEKSAKDAQAKSDQIIRTMTPAQRKEAIANKTLLAQDDPDVMNILRHDTGRTAAFDVENEMQTKISSGEFDQKDRKELEEYRQTRLEMVSQSYAAEAGIDPTDPDYQRGFNTDIVQRNAGLFDLHAQRQSKRFIAQSVINTRGDIGGLLADPNFMRSTESGQQMAAYFENKSATMGFPTEGSMVEAINQTVGDAVNRDHGTNFLKNFGGQEVTVMGVKQEIRDIVGEDKYQNLMVKSGVASYERNRPLYEKFQTDLASAEAQTDLVKAANMIDKIDNENQWIQDSVDMTPQKQAIINARLNLQKRLKEDTIKTVKAGEELMQADNRVLRLDEAYSAKLGGANVDLTKKGMIEDSNTGTFKDSDWAAFADMKLKQINALDIPDAQKDLMRGQYLATDHADGPFRRQFQTLIDDANAEWQGAVVTGDTSNMARINELQRVYAQQPGLIAAIYPDKAGFIEKMNQMSQSGINPLVLIEADKRNATLSKEEQTNRNIQWEALKRDSTSPQLSALPNSMDTMARALYDSFLAGTGDASDASKRVSAWLEKNTVSFQDEDDDSQPGFRGMLNKKDLMADPNDANSWESGKQIVDDTVRGIKSADPYWAEAALRIETNKSGDITITSMTGQQVKITRQSLNLIHQARKRAAAEEAMNREVSDTQRTQEQYKQFIQFGGRGPRL